MEHLVKPLDNPITLRDLVSGLAQRDPNRPVFCFLERGTETVVNALDLHAQACRAAAGLHAQGVRAGDLLLLVFEGAAETVAAFWGMVYLGAVPSIQPYAAAPGVGGDGLGASLAVGRALASSGVRFGILTSQALRSRLEAALPEQIAQVFTLEFAGEADQPWADFPPLEPQATAYIQFSSGTTGLPKGVMLSHAAVLNYLEQTHEMQYRGFDDVVAGWLPLNHDMGLATQVLVPLYSDQRSVIIHTTEWLRHPELLMQALSRFRGTLTWMPNFALRYCLRSIRPDQLAGVDLSSVRIVGVGSETVYADDLEAFVAGYAAYGLRREVMTVGYGLAENVAGVTNTPSGRFPRLDWVSAQGLEEMQALPVSPNAPGSRLLVSCGVPKPGARVQVVDPVGQALGERQVGEVWIGGASLFSGYYQSPESTAQVMAGEWLKTGDLGYLLDGELFICGRIKDLIILGGRKLQPSAIERVAEQALGRLCRYCVAFAVPDPALGTELPVVVCEMRDLPGEPESRQLRAVVREHLQLELQVGMSEVLLVQKGWILKTTSGKLRRAANRNKYLVERVETIAPREVEAPASQELEQALIEIWQELFQRKPIDPEVSFFDLGGDSLLAMQLALEVEHRLRLPLSPAALVETQTIRSLARWLSLERHGEQIELLVPIQRPSSAGKPLLFLVHGVGGGVMDYTQLARALGDGQGVYGIMDKELAAASQGYQSPAPPAEYGIETMAGEYIQVIRELQPHGPYYLGGYCFGGVVAFEMARQLERARERVALVAVLDGYAPPIESQKKGGWRGIVNLVESLPFWLADFLRLGQMELMAWGRQAWQGSLQSLLRLVGRGTLTETAGKNPAALLAAQYRRVLRKHVGALWQYAPGQFSGMMVLFRTEQRVRRSPQADRGWGALNTMPVQIELIPGSHGSILEEPDVQGLAAKLKPYLDIE